MCQLGAICSTAGTGHRGLCVVEDEDQFLRLPQALLYVDVLAGFASIPEAPLRFYVYLPSSLAACVYIDEIGVVGLDLRVLDCLCVALASPQLALVQFVFKPRVVSLRGFRLASFFH